MFCVSIEVKSLAMAQIYSTFLQKQTGQRPLFRLCPVENLSRFLVSLANSLNSHGQRLTVEFAFEALGEIFNNKTILRLDMLHIMR